MEKNKSTLTAALKKLSEYDPPAKVWQGIERDLNYRQNLANLPQYSPPVAVWEGIEAHLEKPQAKVFRLSMQQILALAAMICGVALGWYWLSLDKEATVLVAYSEESYQPQFLAADWNDDEAAIQVVVKEYDRKMELDAPEASPNLKTELQELNTAKAELEELIQRYGKDASVIQEISEIELERTDVIKKMAAAI